MSLTLRLSSSTISTSLPAFIVGIINSTPDSFWEDSRLMNVDSALEKALKMEEEGADILDIGGESSRPGAKYVSEQEELDRVLPLIEAIRSHSSIPISVDTRKSSVMAAAIHSGANICNDISAMEDDPLLANLLAEFGCPVVLMHKKGTPRTMQKDPLYTDVVTEVVQYLHLRSQIAEKSGIDADRIILDPGIGFGKTLNNNCSLIANLHQLELLGYPVMMAVSRKSCIGEITKKNVDLRLAGTLSVNLLAVQNGATFLRVHDVSETHDMLKVLQEISYYGIH
ncbi:MAG TPA: dihydropteroate synthase [Treponemataceae bacterium]|nr:dihydropteroate synthase [Treponemataceae bacterium]